MFLKWLQNYNLICNIFLFFAEKWIIQKARIYAAALIDV